MSKGKTPDGYIPVSAVAANGVPASAAAAWQGGTRDWPQASRAQGSMQQYHQYATAPNYQGRTVERPTSYQGRAPDSTAGYQGRTMDAGYQRRMMDAAPGYQGSAVDGPTGYQGRTVTTSTAYQGRTMGNSTDYQSRAMDGPARYQGRPLDAPAGYQGRTTAGAATYQGRLVQDSTAYQGRMVDGSTGSKLYQGSVAETTSSGKMAEDYKRERKLPPRVEEMLREQVNLDESVLHDAFAVAMEDLIPEHEANFVAKGLCHLCGVSENHYVPVVNFCPHADENHSLCREHLRSVYRVRMEALFVGRNGSAPNRRLLRCLICTGGCPCTMCTAKKEQDVRKYKRYLLDTLRRNGQGPVNATTDGRATTAAATAVVTAAVVSAPISEGRLTYGSVSDGRQYAQYPPTPPAEGRPPIRRDGFSARSLETDKAYEGCRQIPTQNSKYGQYPADERNIRDGYVPSTQAQSKAPSQYPVPKRTAKDTSADMLSVIANSAQATDPRVAARVASPHVHQSSAESPSAATVLNCAESEKSLVELLSSLNQGGTPASSTAMDASTQSSKGSSYRQVESLYATNGITARSENSGNTQGSGDTEMEASPRAFSGRGIVDRHRQADSPYQDQSSTSSNDSGDSPRRDRSSVGSRSVDEPSARKQKASESDPEDSAALRESDDMASRDDYQVVNRVEGAVEEQGSESKHQLQSDANPTLSAKPEDREKESSPKVERNENHSASTPPPHRGPGRPRKHPLPEGYVPPAGKNAQKVAHPPKRGRGRPPKRPKRVKEDDEETEDESYREEEEDDEGEGGSDSELDTNLDFCEVCQGAGDLVCCDKCPRSYHLKCLHMTENDLPEGDWQCDECKKPSRFDAYSTAVTSEQSLLDKCLKIVKCMKSHPFSKPFLTPVENVPMYTRVVKQPMDLSKIENKLKKGAYIVDSNTMTSGVKELDVVHFANDIRLMWSNCKLFNDDGSGITRAADILSAGFERLYKESIEPPLSS
ncbi:hypothetical protein PHYPSEUDO_000630 [Phytophthora pseudosyringae]|uniref:Uncharacterized protein n=1 Tax=Phytophthora pseudosyringae TaxID=221518 RepID=A0A8T1W1Z3_9STRA|nr:hypothetical protein PHYPSEUDO_000630 [Phytophthora pseudosyringae]